MFVYVLLLLFFLGQGVFALFVSCVLLFFFFSFFLFFFFLGGEGMSDNNETFNMMLQQLEVSEHTLILCEFWSQFC